MDNLSSHKKPAVRQAIEAVGATLKFLPAYSPDLNPIEQVPRLAAITLIVFRFTRTAGVQVLRDPSLFDPLV
jgi:hypothetical protein